MSCLSEDLAKHVLDNGLMKGYGVDIFTDYKPDKPDNVLVFTEYSGNQHLSGDACAQRNIQVLYRDSDVDFAKEQSNKLHKLFLSNERLRTFGNNRWAVCRVLTPPRKIKVDEQSRIEYAFNISLLTSND